MRKNIFTYLAASAVAFTVVCLPLATPLSTFAATCDDVKFIFARGSGQTIEDEDFLAYQTSIKAELLRQKSNLKVGFYDLGSSVQGGAKYPAVGLDFLTILGSKISGGKAFTFGDSVKQGIAELVNYTDAVSASCPQTKFVLAGYSQGAMVVGNSLSKLSPSKFIYAAVFGDPKLYLPEGAGAVPSACLGQGFSAYRIYAPDCKTYVGSLNARVPYLAAGWDGKVGLWCKENDIICGASFKFGEPKDYNNLLEKIIQSALSAHTRYPSDGIYTLAAKTIVGKVMDAYPEEFHDDPTLASGNRDTVILLDTSGSMYGFMNAYRSEAERIATETINSGGRIALYAYGDLNDRNAERVVDFTTDLDLFKAFLWSIGSNLDGSSERKNSYLSAVLTVLNNQSWRAGAVKSIIALSNTSILSPDRDGTTKEKVRIRSLEIDPVNLYLTTLNADITDAYEEIITDTGGKIFIGVNTGAAQYLASRPSANFPLSTYSGQPGDSFIFTAETTGEIVKYEWDLDFDGIFETVTDSPTTVKTYSSDTSGYIQLKVTNSAGDFSTASAKVEVSSEKEIAPALSNLKVTKKGTTVSVSYDFNESAIGVQIALDGAILGYTSETTFELSDITKSATLELTPISASGRFGNPLVGEIVISSDDLLAPETGKQ